MSDYLWRVSIVPRYPWDTKPKPVYAVAETKPAVIKYVERHLRIGTVGKVAKLGEALGAKMFN